MGQGCDAPSTGQGGEAVQTGLVGTFSAPDSSHRAFSMHQTYRDSSQPVVGNLTPYDDGMGLFQNYVQRPSSQAHIYSEMRLPHITPPQNSYQQPQVFTAAQGQPLGATNARVFVNHEQSTAESLSEVLGELKIDETGIGKVYFRRVGLTR